MIKMGEHVSLASLASGPKKDMDIMELLDKAQKLIDSPLGKMVMSRLTPPPGPEVKTVYQDVPGPVQEVGIKPRSPVHEKVFKLLNSMDEGQLEAMFVKFAPEGVNVEDIIG